MAKNSSANTGDMALDRWSAVRDRADNQLRRVGMTQWNYGEEDRKQKLNDFSGYLNSGNYSLDNNKKYRDMATQAVADLDTEMKRYGTSSNEYKTLKGYKTYYENALPTFDRLDVGANVQDYLSYDQDKGFTNWHSQDDYNTQKSYLDQQRQAVQTELDAIEDQTSVDYQNLKSWQDQLDMYANALEERNNWDKQFEDVNDYTAYERAGDYKNSIQAKQTLKDAQDQLKETEARLKAMQMKFAAVTDLSTLDGTDAQEYQDFINLQQDYKQLQENVTNAAAEVAGLEKWQKNTATYNLLSQYGEDADYEQILNDLRAAREKAQEGTEDWAKIDLQIRAIAGENEDGLNENGQYDDSTLLGRSIMRDFNLDAAQKRMDEIDQELKDLGVSTSRFWGGVTNADNAFGVDAAGMVYTDENAVGESDPRVMALRQEKTELTRKMNSAEKFQEKDAAETAFKNLSDEDHAALQEEGLKHISQKGNNFYRDSGYDPTQSSGMLENFQYLDDELGGDIRDMLIEAIGAEALGRDIGYTADDIMRLYQGDINHIAGKKEADKISAMDSDFARWNRQVLGVGTQAGLNQFVTGIRQAFSDDYIEPNKTSYKAQYTREDLKRYGDENFINGSNVSQVLFDTTQTTANMLPMIAASYLLTKAGAAPVVGELVGAGLMSLSSGGNTYQQALAEGWDRTDAKAYATILGAAEGTMQYLIGGISGLGGVTEDSILKAAQGINNAAVRFATETGVHILSETTEELAQNRLQRYLDYKLGATDDADWMSWNDDDWYTVIVTALSTGAMEGLPGGINAVRNTKLGNQLAGNAIPGKAVLKSSQARNEIITQIGEAMKGNEALHETLTTIGTNLMEEGSEAYDLAQRMESGKAAKSAWNYGVLYSEILSEYQSRNGKAGIEDGMAAVIGGAIKYHAIQNAETQLEAANNKAEEVRKANPGSEVLSANATALTELGVNDAKQAQKYGALVNKVLSGTDLSDAEMNTLVGDSTAARAARVLIGRQNGMLKADTTADSAREIIKGIAHDMQIRKQQQKAANKMSVVQAAMEAANKYEVSRAAANANLRGVARTEGKAWQGGSIVDNALSGEQDVNWKTTGGAQDYVRADTRRTIEKADADVEAAQARLDQLKKMSYKDMAALHAMGAEDAILEAAIDEDMTNEMAALQKRAEELSAVKFPSKEQKTQLADIRDRQAALKARMLDEYQRTMQRAEAARTEQKRNEESAAIAAKTNDSVDTIVVGGARMTKDAFIQNHAGRLMQSNPNLTQEQANAQALERFNELAAQTQKTEAKEEKQTEAKSERKSKVKPEKKEVVRRQKLDGKAHYWAGGSLEGVQYGAVTESEAEQAIGRTELDFVNNVLSKLVNVTLIKSLPGENGQLIGANGIFYRDGRIYLDINAGTEAHQRSVILTAAHELTHFIRTYNGKAYDKLRDFVEAELKQKGEDIEKLIKREQDNYKVSTGKELSRDKATEEIVANACETMLTDANAINRFAAENPTEAKTILDWLTDFFQRIADAFEDLIAIHPEAKAMQDNINSLRDLWLNALVEADANAAKTTLDDHVQTEVNAEGEDVATTSDNGEGVFNLKTWNDGGRTALEVFLKKRVKGKNLDQTQADEMLEQMDKLYDVCEEYNDGTYGPFSAWSNATVIMGKDGKPAFSVVKTNGEYALNLDFSLVCKKRRALDAVFNEMIERGLMNRVIGDEMFLKMYPASIVQINNYIREAGFETACALCFVDTKRYLQAMKADEFCSIYNGLVNSLIEGTDRKAKYFNYGGDMEFFNTWNNRTGIETLPDFELNWSHINEVLRTEKPTSTLYRMADYIKKNPEGRKLAARGDFMSTNGIDAMTIDHARLLELFHAKQGNSNAKDVVSDTPYFNEVIKSSSFTKEKAYSVGGVRIQSFSDYVGRLVFDYIQMVGDLAAKELPAHSYTKEYQFAMQFGKTGIKINMSLVPRVVEGGKAPGLDANGNYAWMDGQSFGSTVYDNNNKRLTAQQGYELAIQIQNADGYSTNCGTIAVGVSDKHILKMLDDPNIRMIIPYHKSGINHLLAEMNQIGKYKDYTAAQNTRYFVENAKDGVDEITGKHGHWTKLEKGDFNWNDNLQRLEREGKGARECAQLYKDWCAARGYLPKFNDFAYHPNYYKVLEDFTAYDKDGTTPAPLGAVQLNFPVEGDAFGSMQKLIQDGLQEDAVLQAKQDVGVKGIVDRIEAELPAWEAEFREKGDKFAIQTTKESMAKTEMRDNEPMMSSRSAKNSEDEIKSLFDRDDLGLVDFEEKVDRWVADIPVGSVVEWGLPNNRRIATKKADGLFSVTAPDGNRNSVRATELREWLMNNVSHDLWAHDWDEVGVKVRDAGPSFSLRNLPYNVEPTSDRWKRDHTTAEVKKMYPSLWDITADESETRNPTQVRDTVKTYRKIYDLLKAEGFNGRILDASSGLGDGTKAGREEYGFEVDDIEPFPDKSYNPKYTDYDTLNEKYDAIISNAVLNVLPQDQRDALVVKMGELLNPGGKMYINVRGDDVNGNKSNQPIGGKWEYYVSSTGSYQKGFTKPELKAYLEDALGNGFTVDITNKFGKTAAIVTKTAEPSFSLRNGEEMALYIKNDKNGVDFVDEIFNDQKHGETRDYGTLRQGWWGVTRGGKNGQVVGRIELGKPIEFNNDPNSEYYRPDLYADSKIEGTEYDIKPGETKWYYPIISKEDFRNNPKPVLRNGAGGAVYQRDSVESQQAMYSSRDAQYNNWAPEFYSKMANTIDEWTNGKGQPLGAKMAANQVVGWLKGKGVKSEEIKWSGIIPYLEGKKTVTKEELQQVMAENEIKIETKVLGGDQYYVESPDGKQQGIKNAYDYSEELAESLGISAESIVHNIDWRSGDITLTRDDTGEVVGELKAYDNEEAKWKDYTLEGGENYREILFRLPGLTYSNEAIRMHWGSSNAGTIAHARVQDMTARNGRPVLFVEEIQSDLHNEGARSRFVESEIPKGYDVKKVKEFKRLYEKANQEYLSTDETNRLLELEAELIPGNTEYYVSEYERDSARDLAKSAAQGAINRLGANTAIRLDFFNPRSVMRWMEGKSDGPLALSGFHAFNMSEEEVREEQEEAARQLLPFIEEDDRMVIQDYLKAVEDFVAKRNARDSFIEKLIGKGVPNVPFAGEADTYHEYVMKHLLRLAAEGEYDFIGWTTADQQSERWSNEFAEGYKIEYDQTLPKFMNKYGKQWGAKVGSTVLENGEEVWSVPVTEEMKKSVLETGQPLFSSRDAFSRPREEVDAEYADAVSEGNVDWQKQLVAEAANAAGYTTHAYHGSPIKDITVFRTRSEVDKPQKMQLLFGTHFTTNKDFADLYARKAKNSKGTSRMTTTTGRTYGAYLDLGKSLDLRTAQNYTPGSEMYSLYEDLPENIKKKVQPREFTAYDTSQGLGEGKFITARTIEDALERMTPKAATEFLVSHGFNSVLYDARYNTGSWDNNRFSRDPSIIMLDANRIKSDDPITYDNNGNIIPLSERFNRESEDIRYSTRGTNAPENTNPYPENTLEHDMLEAARNGTLSEWVTEQMNAHEDALENAKIRPPVIPSKGFVPKVTAQEKAALETRRKGLIQAKGAMKPSEKSNGFAMPKKDEAGNWFHRFLQNVGSAKELKVAQDQVEKFAFTDVAGTYVPDSNKADLNWAKNVISEDGLDSAVKQFNREAMKMEMPSNVTKSLALGQQLLIETSRQGDMQKFLDVLSSLTLLSSQAGKSLQAFRMLKQSGPIGELYYVQKAVGQLNDRHADKITAGRMSEITVPEDLANDVLMASTQEEQDKAMDALIAGIAQQVPVTLMDKWNAWRYLAMLGNARTHVRNVIGNAVFVPLRFAKDLMAAGGEFLATKTGLMEEQDRRKALVVSRELRDFAKQDALAMQKELQGSGKYNPAREILDARKVLPGFLETLSRKNGELLEFEDWLFLSPAYQNALSQALAHTGYSLSEMLDGSNKDAVKALNNARRIAIEEAQKATYRDFNAAASMLNRIKRMESGKASDKVIGVLLEGILPFTKTPINILRRGVEYSPIGIASSIFEAAAGVKNGNLDVAQFIDHLSAGLSGTAVAVLGYLLASLGYIRNKKDDKEEEFDKLQGYQDYSIQVGKVSATIDWAAPTALPLFTGAAAYDMIQRDEGLEWKDAWDAMMMIAEPMMSLSMLDGLNSTLSAASYADDSQKLATVASSAFTSYLGQAFPTLLGQVARSIDGTRRSTYVDKNSPVPTAIQRFVQSSVQNKIPVWEEQKIPYIDQWGREDTVSSKFLGAMENFLSPSYVNIVHTTDVDEALRDLYNTTKDSGVLPSTVSKYFSVAGERKDLTADEYVSYAKDVGSTKYQLLTSLFSDPRYMSLTDDQKAEAVSVIYKYATAAGKYHIDQNYDLHAQGKWIEEAEAAATDVQRFNRIWEYLEEHFKK